MCIYIYIHNISSLPGPGGPRRPAGPRAGVGRAGPGVNTIIIITRLTIHTMSVIILIISITFIIIDITTTIATTCWRRPRWRMIGTG